MLFDPISFDQHDLAWTGLEKSEIDRVLNAGIHPLQGDRSRLERANPGMRELYIMKTCPEYMYFTAKTLLNLDISPMQACMWSCMWTHSFPMLIGSRGLSKSFSLAAYALLRAALIPGTKVVFVGAAFRQSKILHAYVETIFKGSPVLQSIFKDSKDGTKTNNDSIIFRMGDSTITSIPLGNGEKIRGLRANVIIADEMNSLDTDVYEIVVNNFAAVSMDPIKTMQRKAKVKSLMEAGLEVPEELIEAGVKNQSIIAGTMGYEFQPMYSYWQKYKDIITSKGASFGEDEADLSYKDFCIMRLPYELIPKGFMDDKTIARAKATIHMGAYNSEYGCVAVKDSTGFFSRAAIEKCVANDNAINQDDWPAWCPQSFDAKTFGTSDCTYVMGVDPASETDNFAITILEVHEDHQRVVYCWTTNREEAQKDDKTISYYAYCARKIRELAKDFDVRVIGIDAQGGGREISEVLHDEAQLKPGEVPFWEEIDPKKPKETDNIPGNHILRLFEFSNYNWLSNANHNLKKDIEDRTILFPRYNSVILGIAASDAFGSSDLEDCVMDIEEIKDELSTIVMTVVGASGRQRWDTPQVKTGTNKVGRLRKDRYSSLLMSNTLAREINRGVRENKITSSTGVGAGAPSKIKNNQSYYVGDSQLIQQIGRPNYRAVQR